MGPSTSKFCVDGTHMKPLHPHPILGHMHAGFRTKFVSVFMPRPGDVLAISKASGPVARSQVCPCSSFSGSLDQTVDPPQDTQAGHINCRDRLPRANFAEVKRTSKTLVLREVDHMTPEVRTRLSTTQAASLDVSSAHAPARRPTRITLSLVRSLVARPLA